LDSIIRDTSLSVAATGEVTGKINFFNSAVLQNYVQILNRENPLLNLKLPLSADGSFHFPAESLLGKSLSLMNLKFFVSVKDTGYRPSPDTVRLALDRRQSLIWSLDLDLASDAIFQVLARDTVAISKMQGEVQGKVNGFIPIAMYDSLYFRNMIYPELFANIPLDPNGSFSFNASEIVGSLDGLHIFKIFMKSRSLENRLSPDTLKIDLSIP
jgi:hypothetical protein